MTEPQTQQELNEAVAKALGLVYEIKGKRVVIWPGADDPRDDSIFDPATDPEAALWALDRWCEQRKMSATLNRFDRSKRDHVDGLPKWSCILEAAGGNGSGDTAKEAICLAIMGAAE